MSAIVHSHGSDSHSQFRPLVVVGSFLVGISLVGLAWFISHRFMAGVETALDPVVVASPSKPELRTAAPVVPVEEPLPQPTDFAWRLANTDLSRRLNSKDPHIQRIQGKIDRVVTLLPTDLDKAFVLINACFVDLQTANKSSTVPEILDCCIAYGLVSGEDRDLAEGLKVYLVARKNAPDHAEATTQIVLLSNIVNSKYRGHFDLLERFKSP